MDEAPPEAAIPQVRFILSSSAWSLASSIFADKGKQWSKFPWINILQGLSSGRKKPPNLAFDL